MVLKLTSEEVPEVYRALSVAHLQVLRELHQLDGCLNRQVGLELCRRKWKLESLLRQLEQPAPPVPVLELVPTCCQEVLQSKAA